MKIIKEGKKERIEKPKRFMCRYCECVFEADNEEYKTFFDRNEIYYLCECPFCKRNTYVIRISVRGAE